MACSPPLSSCFLINYFDMLSRLSFIRLNNNQPATSESAKCVLLPPSPPSLGLFSIRHSVSLNGFAQGLIHLRLEIDIDSISLLTEYNKHNATQHRTKRMFNSMDLDSLTLLSTLKG